MKTFIDHNLTPLKRILHNNKRLYLIENQKYPSVTTITSLLSAESIKKWRESVGEEEANRISKKASKRGTSIHSLCEAYLKGDDYNTPLCDVDMFHSLKPHLEHIDNIHCLESPLYSNSLKIAGTVDCIAEYCNELSVIDFKTSTKPKKKEWIEGYFMQAAAYSYMFYERTRIAVPNIKIIIGVDDEEPQIFSERATPWLKKFIELRKDYERKYGI